MKITDYAFQKGLPCNPAAEASILGSCLVSGESLDIAKTLIRTEDFSVHRNRILWEIACGLREAGRPVDRVIVIDELMKADKLESVTMAYIAELEPLPSTVGLVEQYCRELREKTIRRDAYHAAERLRQSSLEERPSQELIQQMERMASAMSEKSTFANSPTFGLSDIFARDFSGRWDELCGATRTPAVPIGFTEPLGGLRQGELTILAARPAVGKSTMAMQIGIDCGEPTMLWSLEMKGGPILQRMVASRSGVSHYKLTRGYANAEEKALAWKALQEICDLPLAIADSHANVTVESIRLGLKIAAQKRQLPKLVIVDYLQLLDSSGGSNRNEQISHITRQLKALTLEYGVAVLALSQLSRDQEKQGNREPQLSDLRDSGSIEQDADSVVFLHGAADQGERVKEVLWIVRKQRNGSTGKVQLLFHKDQLRFAAATS